MPALGPAQRYDPAEFCTNEAAFRVRTGGERRGCLPERHLPIPGSQVMERIRIFDTTLRDGEQSPGYGMTASQKLVLARQLERLGVDVIEAGFPAASEEDLQGVRSICREVRKPTIAALARCV